MPPQAGPYHNPQHRNDLEKIALTKDMIAPEDVGIVPCDDTGDHPLTNPKDRRSDEKIEEKREEKKDKQDERDQKKFDKQEEKRSEQQKEFDPTGRPEDGRPKNSKDKEKRKQREVEPRKTINSSEFIVTSLWAGEAQSKISDIINPAILAHYGKSSLRSLTKSEIDQLEHLKLCILCGIEPFIEITPEVVSQLLSKPVSVDPSVAKLLAGLKEDFLSKNGKEPNIDEVRRINISCYTLSKTG